MQVNVPDGVFVELVLAGFCDPQGHWRDAPLSASEAAALRELEVGILGRDPSRTPARVGERIDRLVAGVLVEAGDCQAEPMHVVEALLRIAAGIAVVTNHVEETFVDFARGVYREERRARAVENPQADGVLTLGMDGVRMVDPASMLTT